MTTTDESVVFSGRVGEVIHTDLPDGRFFERYRRPPGTRLIIISPDNKILVTKEYRHENNGYDLRLPGGKVRDSPTEYNELLASDVDFNQAVIDAAKREALEETGLVVNNLELITVANAGATVEWDLHYFLTRDYEVDPLGQQLKGGEDIEIAWLSLDEIVEAIENGEMSEWRSVGVLLGLVIPKILNS